MIDDFDLFGDLEQEDDGLFNTIDDSSFDSSTDDEYEISDEELDDLINRAKGIEREDHHDGISIKSVKICATRHGCTGVTNCDYEMSGPVGR